MSSALVVLVGIVAVSILHMTFPGAVSWAFLLPFVVLSGTFHSPRWHAGILGAALAALLITSPSVHGATSDVLGPMIAVCAVGAITLWRSMARARVGVQGTRGETMLADLRRRLIRQGRIPRLPAPWSGELCVQPAFGHRFSGDFVVSRRTREHLLEVMLVDIAGKGMDAGARSLLLSGGLDALVGIVSPHELLSVANDYVLRQDWTDGFATAAYLSLDLQTGAFSVGRAGHPPVVWYRKAADEWRIIDGLCGPVLGLTSSARYDAFEGRLLPGDALMLYTDGLIEDRGGDLDLGIGRMITGLRALSPGGFTGVASRLCGQAASGEKDDRGVVLLWRD